MWTGPTRRSDAHVHRGAIPPTPASALGLLPASLLRRLRQPQRAFVCVCVCVCVCVRIHRVRVDQPRLSHIHSHMDPSTPGSQAPASRGRVNRGRRVFLTRLGFSSPSCPCAGPPFRQHAGLSLCQHAGPFYLSDRRGFGTLRFASVPFTASPPGVISTSPPTQAASARTTPLPPKAAATTEPAFEPVTGRLRLRRVDGRVAPRSYSQTHAQPSEKLNKKSDSLPAFPPDHKC